MQLPPWFADTEIAEKESAAALYQPRQQSPKKTIGKVKAKAAKFVRVWLLTLVFSLGSVAVANWLINPYGVYSASPTLNGVNQKKTGKSENDRLVKAVEIIQQQPEHLIMGSSRVKKAIDPNHELLPANTYNAGLNGASIYELRRYVEHAIANQPDLKQITLGLDFFMFNTVETSGVDLTKAVMSEAVTREVEANGAANNTEVSTDATAIAGDLNEDSDASAAITREGFADYRLERSHLSFKDWLSTALSTDALLESYETLLASRQSPQSAPLQSDDGFNPTESSDGQTLIRFKQDLKKFFVRNEQFVLTSEAVNEFAQIVALCEAHDIELTVFISPSHAAQWEAITQTNNWEAFEQWKRAMVELAPVWDFSGYNSVTTEPVAADMANYTDNSHYSQQRG